MMRQPQSAPQVPTNVLRDVDRALAELRRGAPVVLLDEAGSGALVQAAETASDSGLTGLERTTCLQALEGGLFGTTYLEDE